MTDNRVRLHHNVDEFDVVFAAAPNGRFPHVDGGHLLPAHIAAVPNLPPDDVAHLFTLAYRYRYGPDVTVSHTRGRYHLHEGPPL